MSESFSYLAYLLGWKIVALLPERSAYALFSAIATRTHSRNGKSVRRLRINLSIVQPHLDKAQLENLVEKALKSSMRYWCDTFRIHKWSAERIES
jgi:KDO2-lipid IV(A) lauroyltransferase